MADFKNQKERLLIFIRYKNLNNSTFEKIMSLSNGYINSMRKGLGYDKLEHLSISFPELNMGWLLTGEGPMLKNEQMEDKVVTNATNTSNTQIAHTSTATQTANKPMDTPSNNNALLYKMYIDIQSKDAEITELKLINQKQEACIEKLVKALEHYENIGTIQDDNKMQEHHVGDAPFAESSLLTPPPSARVNVRIRKRQKQ